MPKLSGIPHLRAVKAFEKVGFTIRRQSGHIVMGKGDIQIEIPRHNPVNPYIMAKLIKQAGLTLEQFKDLL